MQKIALHIELDNNVYDMQCMSSVDTIPTGTAKGKVPLPEGYSTTVNILLMMVMLIYCRTSSYAINSLYKIMIKNKEVAYADLACHQLYH